MRTIPIYAINYYEDKYFIRILRTLRPMENIYPNFTHLLKISIKNHQILYIYINTHNYLKKYK